MTIALLTDFGSADAFAGIMKGVILSRVPDARIVDLSHGVPPQDVRNAAMQLMSAVPYFPDGTLFVCVVDPGVGSRRAVVWAKTARHSFLAPDNGLLSWVPRVEKITAARTVSNRKLFLPRPSRTFHGRDIFAPAAAALASGTPPSALGPKRRRVRSFPFPRVSRAGGRVRGEVIALDGFGNAVTNLTPADLGRGMAIEVRGVRIGAPRPHYAAVAPGRPLAVVGSSGFVELSVRDGNFAADSGVGVGEIVYGKR